MKIKGVLTALITPFHNGRVDYGAFEKLVQWQLESNIHGLVPCGSTGESFFLSHEEQKNLIQRCVSVVNKRIPVIAGASAITTDETLLLVRQAKEARADAALVVTPPYVKPGSEALYQHYKTLNDQANFPIIMYNNPGRTGLAMDQETIYRLGKLSHIIGIKDSTNDLTRPTFTRINLGETFLQFSGEDPTAISFLSQGGIGWISVISNIAPRLCVDLYVAWEERDATKMATLRDMLMPLMKALFIESNPVPVKYAASLLGFCQNELRRPLLEARSQTQEVVQEVMKKIKLI